jgi:hypothetical protein
MTHHNRTPAQAAQEWFDRLQQGVSQAELLRAIALELTEDQSLDGAHALRLFVEFKMKRDPSQKEAFRQLLRQPPRTDWHEDAADLLLLREELERTQAEKRQVQQEQAEKQRDWDRLRALTKEHEDAQSKLLKLEQAIQAFERG